MEIKVSADNFRLVPIDEIYPDPSNTNTHPEDQIEMLVEQFKIQGFRDSLIVDKADGLLVCGEGRLIAAIRAGFKELPVIYQDFDSPKHKKAFITAHNASQNWSKLDFKKINLEIQDLGPDFDVSWMAIKDFKLDPIELEVGVPEEKPSKYVLEVEFKNDMEMMDIHDDLVYRGYDVKIKK